MKKLLTATVVIGLFSSPAFARDLFSVVVTTEGVTQTQGANDIRDVIDFIDDGNYEDINSVYNETSIAVANFDIRGVAASVNYPNAGATLIFEVPELGIREVFAEATRAQSEDALIDFLESNQNDLLTRLLQALVEKSPVDPVAGNPNSLMSKMVAADFSNGTVVGPNSSFSATGETEGDAPNLIGAGARFGRFAAGDFDSNVIDLPFRYVMPLADPRYAINFDLPLTIVEAEGAMSYAASFGTGIRVPVLDNWSITPSLRLGATGSVETGGAALLYSASATSNYEIDFEDFKMAFGNSATFIQSAPLNLGDFDVDYDLTNMVVRNGIEFSGETPLSLLGEAVTWEASVVNTQFFGDALFVENATDLSISLGTKESESGLVWDSVRLGLTYTFTDSDFQGLRLNFGYQF
ncbi:MAG: hypothetical protein ACFB03_02175 [Paracoccaceae bacterium]